MGLVVSTYAEHDSVDEEEGRKLKETRSFLPCFIGRYVVVERRVKCLAMKS